MLLEQSSVYKGKFFTSSLKDKLLIFFFSFGERKAIVKKRKHNLIVFLKSFTFIYLKNVQ